MAQPPAPPLAGKKKKVPPNTFDIRWSPPRHLQALYKTNPEGNSFHLAGNHANNQYITVILVGRTRAIKILDKRFQGDDKLSFVQELIEIPADKYKFETLQMKGHHDTNAELTIDLLPDHGLQVVKSSQGNAPKATCLLSGLPLADITKIRVVLLDTNDHPLIFTYERAIDILSGKLQPPQSNSLRRVDRLVDDLKTEHHTQNDAFRGTSSQGSTTDMEEDPKSDMPIAPACLLREET